MGNRLTRVYTRTGDEGTTGLADGSRRAKNDPRVICMGEIDELNACLGVALGFIEHDRIRQLLFAVQHDLFDIGAELCQPGKTLIDEAYVTGLERQSDELNRSLPPLREFILPGGSRSVAYLHLARTVCRRVERSLVTLAEAESDNPLTRAYVNRLSDLLFILARSEAREDGEIYWNSRFSRINRG